MTVPTNTPLREEDHVLAAELVLGLLEPVEVAQARARVATDPTFAAEVAAWEARFEPMLGSEDVAPPETVWPRVAAQLPAASGQDNTSRLRFWQGLSVASMAAAAVLGVMLMNAPADTPVPATPAPLIAAIGGETGQAIAARYDPATGGLTITPVRLDTGALYPELWLVPKGGTPISLGMLDPKTPRVHSVPEPLRAAMNSGALLAVTPEPKSGAPGGKATGPIIASGALQTI
jgi:anti-sigma-K factor RskA